MVVAGTGHRPNKLGGYSKEAFSKLVTLAENFIEEFAPDKIISGMALGWDQALAVAAIRTKTPFIAAVPFHGQESMWNEPSQKYYHKILSRAESVHIVAPGTFSAHKMQLRNQWMVDHATLILALWDGTSGGTKNCIDYALAKNKILVNLYQEYLL